jgi:hypothetical protein
VTSLELHDLIEMGVDWEHSIEDLSETGEAVEDLSLDKVRLKLQRPRLLVVAYEIDETTQRIAQFLRQMGVPIYCIEFQYFEDDEQEYYYPEIIGVEKIDSIPTPPLTPAQRAYRELWTDLLQNFNERMPGLTRRRPVTGSWLDLPIGLANAHLAWHVHGLDRSDGWFEVGLHLEHAERDRNLAGLEWLTQHQQDLERVVGEPLLLQEYGKRWARAYAKREAPRLDESVQDWALQTMYASMMRWSNWT